MYEVDRWGPRGVPEVSEIICTILPAFPYREGPELKLHSLGCICPPPPNLRTLDLGKAEGFFGSGSRIRIITLKMMGFPGGSAGKEPVCNGGDLGSIPGLGRSPGEGKGSPLQYSFRPGEFHGLYSPWGPKELDMADRLKNNWLG